jgi:hypothetical protein
VKPLYRSLLVMVAQLAIVLALVAQYAWDRATLPKGWFQAQPYDPELPIRGRYVSLRLLGLPKNNDVGGPVAFFIPEHVADPSQRPAGEELWVEVSLPPVGPPRPVRLGVKKDGVLKPLELR